MLAIDNLSCHLAMDKNSLPTYVDLTQHRAVELRLRAFLLRALQARVDEANDGASAGERVTLDELVELQLAETLSLAEVARLERSVPGIAAAVSAWLTAIE
jgi:hypothetical protein